MTSVPPASLPEGYRLAPLDDADRDLMLDLTRWGFVFEPHPEDAGYEVWKPEANRSVGIWDERGEGAARLAAMHTSYQMRTPVPGGADLPTSGLSMVVVHPSHRRRGLARAMLGAHFNRSLERGEVLSALYAAESGIYGRYGYGPATTGIDLKVGRGATLRDVPGAADLISEIDTLDAAQHGPIVDQVHRAVTRPGWITRDTEALRDRHLLDKPSERRETERLRILIVRDQDGTPRGYALFRRQAKWSHTGSPKGAVQVREAVALDAAAARALWGTLSDLDLMSTVETGFLTPDDPLLHLLVDLRPTDQTLADAVWLRLLDVPAALASRAYAAPVDVVLDISDTMLASNEGRWHLRGDAEGAEVSRTEEPAHLALDVADLAEIYLGGTQLAALAGAGRVREVEPGRVNSTSTGFGWPVAPGMSWGF